MAKSSNESFWWTAGAGGPKQGYQISKPQRSTVAQVGSWRKMGRGEQNIMINVSWIFVYKYPFENCVGNVGNI